VKARAKFVAAAVVAAALLGTGFAAAMLAGPSSASSSKPTVPQHTTGSFTLAYSAHTCESQINQSLPACWNCTYPVDLDQVDITVDPTLATDPNAITEGVRIGPGCTGRIGLLTVHTNGGDGIKVVKGAHDLVVGYGSVTCQTPPAGLTTSQYGIRVFGGHRVTLAGMYVNCQTSNSKIEYFVNQVPAQNTGAPLANRPSDVLLAQSCLASGPTQTALIGGSKYSGALSSVLYPFTPGPGNGPTFDVPGVTEPTGPGGGNTHASYWLDFANEYPASQSSCVNANG
jgi:hypothetical protein